VKWAHPRLGRRGACLLGFALLDILYAVRLLTVDPDEQSFYTWVAGVAPLWLWSIPWFLVAMLCLVGAFKDCDRAAFAGAIFIKVVTGALYLSGWLLNNVHDGWVLAAFFLTFAWTVWWVAGWPEPVDRRGVTWTPPPG
jgi:hypothetical protein